jgi:hypothetical protein
VVNILKLTERYTLEKGGTPVILALGRLRQENGEFEASAAYITRPCLQKKRSFIIYELFVSLKSLLGIT